MKNLQIFDPAMCCSTGVCGPSVDPKLVQLAADVAFLKSKGVSVERFNLGHQPDAFMGRPEILAAMGEEAEHLPIFVVDGEIVSKGTYPSRADLCGWLGLEMGTEAEVPRTKLSVIGGERCC